MSVQIHLTEDELKRYDRHLRLADFGLDKQLKLKQSKVLIIGAGGLGCPIGLYLAASGVGTIGIADDDKIELSNLQRQIAFSAEEVGYLKSTVLAKKLRALNPSLNVVEHPHRVVNANVENLVQDYDLVIDGTDNFATRFLLADTCFLNGISYLHASVHQYQGQISLFLPGTSPCFRCLYRQPPQTTALAACSEAGILGVVTGTVGLMTATEAIKYLSDFDNCLAGKVLVYDALNQQSKQLSIEGDKNCPLCSGNIENTRNEQNMSEEKIVMIDQGVDWIKNNEDLCLLDVREEHEYEQGHIPQAGLLPLSILKTLFANSAQNKIAQHYLSLLPADKQKKILCYCRRGGRSLQATDILRQAGFSNTYSLDGGFEQWDSP